MTKVVQLIQGTFPLSGTQSIGQIKLLHQHLINEGSPIISTYLKHGTYDSELLFVIELESVEELEDHAKNFVESSAFLAFEESEISFLPEVWSLKVDRTIGLLASQMKIGSFLSLSRRVAEPGYSRELANDLVMVFEGLATISGLLGWIAGENITLAEEIVGIAHWADESSYRQSLPAVEKYEIKLFEKIS